MTTDALDPKTIALKFYPPLRDGNTSEASAFLSDDWSDIPLNPGQSPGPSGYQEMVSKLRGFIPNLTWTIEDVIAGGDRVVVRSSIRGVPEGHVMGIHFSGHEVTFEAIDIHQIADGKIVKTWHVEDKMSILKQFGVPHLSFR
jgi:predicted ester cyclase